MGVRVITDERSPIAPSVPVLTRDRVRVPPLGGSVLAGFSPRGRQTSGTARQGTGGLDP